MTATGNYHAYLLRVWRETDAAPWRATLEDPHTGERLAFAGADQLLAYLRRQLPPGAEPEPGPPAAGDT